MDRVLEKVRVVMANSNGEWSFEDTIERSENLGEKYVIIKNNSDKTTKNLDIKSDYLVQIATSAIRYNEGDTVVITGNSEPKQDTSIWINDQDGKIIRYDRFTSGVDGSLNYEFVVDDAISIGTYTIILKQENGADSTLFGVGKYPSPSIITLMEKTNFTLNSKAVLSIMGPTSSKLSIKILDSNDNIELTDSITTTSTGKSKYAIDLDGLSSGIYRAVVSSTNIQDSVKFSVGLEAGSGEISLISIQTNYSPGESILLLGTTGSDARLTITLYDPSGNVSSATETFSDSSGSFATNDLGIPLDGEFGSWKITAHSRLDTKTIDINVSVPTEKGITLELEDTEFLTGQTVTIKGMAQSDTSRLQIKITNENDTLLETLETPITSCLLYTSPSPRDS